MSKVVSFHKLKLTNNISDKNGLVSTKNKYFLDDLYSVQEAYRRMSVKFCFSFFQNSTSDKMRCMIWRPLQWKGVKLIQAQRLHSVKSNFVLRDVSCKKPIKLCRWRDQSLFILSCELSSKRLNIFQRGKKIGKVKLAKTRHCLLLFYRHKSKEAITIVVVTWFSQFDLTLRCFTQRNNV